MLIGQYQFTQIYILDKVVNQMEQPTLVIWKINSSKYLGLGQFHIRKWLAWYRQVVLNFLVSSFILKKKILCFDDLPLLSAIDLKDGIVYKLNKEMSDNQIINKIFVQHYKQQSEINYSHTKT